MPQVVYSVPGTYTFFVPIGVTSITVHLRGAGGGGSSGGTGFGKGGGGGAYVRSVISVTPGATHTIVIPSGGAVQGTINSNGNAPSGNTTFDTTTVVAKSGVAATTGAGGAGGTVAASTGDVEFAGGTGSSTQGAAGTGGGGGGSAGSTGAGGNGSTSTGGSAGTGGTSGDGTSLAGTAGMNGAQSFYNPSFNSNGSGGGGGGTTAGGFGTTGGKGGDGWALVEWTDPGNTVVTLTPADTSFEVPAGVTEIQVEGVGGGGGSSQGRNTAGGGALSGPGGGGGARSVSILTVTPGDTYSLQVGEGGAAAGSYDADGGGDGEDTWFDSSSVFLAKGAAGKVGGDAASGIGDIKWSGGDGVASSTSTYGGPGGGAAPFGADGGDGNGGGASVGGTGDAAGKNGTLGFGTSGTAGDAPGGGPSGGSGNSSGGGGLGAAGGDGRLYIEFVPPTPIIEQTAFRFYNDDGDEDGSTPAAAENTNITHPLATNLRLRLQTDLPQGEYASLRRELRYKLSTDSVYLPVPTGIVVPSVRSVGALAAGTGNVSPVPPTHFKDDILLLYVESAGTPGSAPSGGWDVVPDSPQDEGTTTALEVYWLRATDGATATPSVTDRGDHTTARIIAIKDCIKSGNPWDVTNGGTEAASTSLTAAGDTTTVDNCLIVIASSRDNDSASAAFSAWANADLTSVAEIAGFDSGSSLGNGGGIAAATGVKATAGAFGNTTATATSSAKAWHVVALKPWIAAITLSPSTHIGAGGAATTARLTAPSGQTFDPGRIQDDENPADATSPTYGEYTEDEFSLITSGPAADGDVYQFRMYNYDLDEAYDTYDYTPEWTIGSGSDDRTGTGAVEADAVVAVTGEKQADDSAALEADATVAATGQKEGASAAALEAVASTDAVGHRILSFNLRAAWYYGWYPEAWDQLSIDPFSQYEPGLGFYDSGDTATIDAHLDMLDYAKVDIAIVSWWSPSHWTHPNLLAMLDRVVATGSNVKLALYYEREGNLEDGVGPNPTAAQIASDLDFLKAEGVLDHPAFAYIDSRPAIFAYGDGSDDSEPVENNRPAKRWEDARALLAYDIWLSLKVYPDWPLESNQPDHWHQYGPAVRYDQQGSLSAAISAGFWRPDETTPRLVRSLKAFGDAILDAIAADVDITFFYFNEWGEGSALELAVGGNGYDYSGDGWPSDSGYGLYLDILHNDGVVETDTGEVEADAVVDATGQKHADDAAALEADAAVAATGEKQATGSVALEADATTAATGESAREASVDVEATADPAASGSGDRSNTAAVEADATVSSTGASARESAAQLEADATVSATGVKHIDAAVDVEAVATVEATGTPARAGSAAVEADATTSATGASTRSSSATVEAEASPEASGTSERANTAAVSADVDVAATGASARSGAASIEADATVAATGTSARSSDADVEAIAKVIASADVVPGAVVFFEAVAEVSATGIAHRFVQAAIAADAEVSASGESARASAAAVEAEASTSASGTSVRSGSASTSAESSVAALGTSSRAQSAAIVALSAVAASTQTRRSSSISLSVDGEVDADGSTTRAQAVALSALVTLAVTSASVRASAAAIEVIVTVAVEYNIFRSIITVDGEHVPNVDLVGESIPVVSKTGFSAPAIDVIGDRR